MTVSKAPHFSDRLVDEDVPVWISEVMHSAAIEVDEKGTTAAAVTLIAADAAYLSHLEPFEMVCDTPFVFVLTGTVGAVALFTGIVNSP